MVHKENLEVWDQSPRLENKELKALLDLMVFLDQQEQQVDQVVKETQDQQVQLDQRGRQEMQDQRASEDRLGHRDLKVQSDFQDQLAGLVYQALKVHLEQKEILAQLVLLV